MGVHGEHDMWGVPRPLHLRGAPREAERLVVHLRGSWGVALEPRLVLHSFLHTRLVCVRLARLAGWPGLVAQVRLSLGARGHVRGAPWRAALLVQAGAGRGGLYGGCRPWEQDSSLTPPSPKSLDPL